MPPRDATNDFLAYDGTEKKAQDKVGMIIKKRHPEKRSEADGCEIAFSPPRGVTPFPLQFTITQSTFG